ncbi:MAG: leucyl/phenylalanyl-tRNA--protein transferase [Gammaproteobacteria bacterium]|jgi:leucyl/phenylalanyl-tRNA--protein transferase|nr:leucyl/phenylalanyl-tRNA--protein transferase [Gammaproteobacteria bacterium]
MIPWLDPDSSPYFPSTSHALEEPAGLLAAGGRLSTDWLLLAYRHGIFPWFNHGEPILWWSPAPRTVLYPQNFHQSKSLRKLARQGRYQITENCDFNAVVAACAANRPGQQGTWINRQMIDAYCAMHLAGYVHSIECRDGVELVGGLYGVVIGRVFFGESMFSRVANASKLCIKHLVDCDRYKLIDCQLPTEHLHSLGAGEISRSEFETELAHWTRPFDREIPA